MKTSVNISNLEHDYQFSLPGARDTFSLVNSLALESGDTFDLQLREIFSKFYR